MTAPVAQMTDEEWLLEIDWNLNHVFWGMRRALQHMIPRQSGRIIVTSSVEGKLGKPGIPGYVTTKHAVNGLVKSAAQEVGTLGITVNAILPGIIETDIVPLDRTRLGDRDGPRGLRPADRRCSPKSRRSSGRTRWKRSPRLRCCWRPTRHATSPAACSRWTAGRCRTDQSSWAGSANSWTIVWQNAAAGAPSRTRWSHVRLSVSRVTRQHGTVHERRGRRGAGRRPGSRRSAG